MKHSLASRAVAVIIVSVLLTWLVHLFDQQMLQKASGMTNAQIATHYRNYHDTSIAFTALAMLMTGMLYTMGIEFISFLLRTFCWPIDSAATGKNVSP